MIRATARQPCHRFGGAKVREMTFTLMCGDDGLGGLEVLVEEGFDPGV